MPKSSKERSKAYRERIRAKKALTLILPKLTLQHVREWRKRQKQLQSCIQSSNTESSQSVSPLTSCDKKLSKTAAQMVTEDRAQIQNNQSIKKKSQTTAKKSSKISDLPLSPIASISHVPTTFVVEKLTTMHQLNLQPVLSAEQSGSVDRGNMLQIKEESGEVDIGPITLQHMDSHYRTNQQDTSVIKQENVIYNNNVNATLCGGVQEKCIGKTSFPYFSYVKPIAPLLNTCVNRQRCAQAISTPAGAGSMNVAFGGLGPGIYIKVDVANLIFGPAVLDPQHMVPATHQNTRVVETENMMAYDNNDSILGNTVEEQTVEDKYGAGTGCNNVIPSEQRIHSMLYSCEKCEQTFTSNDTYSRHYSQAHLAEPHKNNECNEESSFESSLHIHTIHGGKLQYVCAVCKKIYKSRDGLRNHIIINHRPKSTDAKPNIYICDYCQKTFSRKLRIIDHIACVHTSGSFKCNLCDKSFRCDKYLRTHKARMHIPCVKACNVCGKFMGLNNLKKHMLNMHSGKKLQCKICGEIVMSRLNLHYHLNSVHGQQSSDSPFVNRCGYCQKIYTSKKNLNSHIRNVHGTSFHRCSECKANFQTDYRLRRHIKLVHSKQQSQREFYKKIFKCKMYYKSDQQSKCSNFEEENIESTHVGESGVKAAASSGCGGNYIAPGRQQNVVASTQHQVQDAAFTSPTVSEGNAAASASTRQQDVVVMKEEPADGELELGPVVFQHMDCNYRSYKEEPLLD